MKPCNHKLTAEVKNFVEQGADILRKAQSSTNPMEGEELAEFSSWVTRLGQFLSRTYGRKSQQFLNYSQALATTNFYSLHKSWNAHIAQLLGIAESAAHDLEHDLTPAHPSDDGVVTLTDEHGPWWFFQHCTSKTRTWLVAAALTLLSAAYFAGRNDFLSQLVELWRKNAKP